MKTVRKMNSSGERPDFEPRAGFVMRARSIDARKQRKKSRAPLVDAATTTKTRARRFFPA
jgi:hypothetical protein